MMANWIAMFDYSKAHKSKRLSLISPSLSKTSNMATLFEIAL